MLEQLSAGGQQAQLQMSRSEEALAAATRELASAQSLVNAPDRTAQLASANQALTDALAEQAAVAAKVMSLKAEISQARPDILQQDAERFKKSAEELQKVAGERLKTLITLEAELNTLGATGLDERRAELAVDWAQAQRRATELRRRAKALDHLLQLLRQKRKELTRQLQAPLQKYLNHLLHVFHVDLLNQDQLRL